MLQDDDEEDDFEPGEEAEAEEEDDEEEGEEVAGAGAEAAGEEEDDDDDESRGVKRKHDGKCPGCDSYWPSNANYFSQKNSVLFCVEVELPFKPTFWRGFVLNKRGKLYLNLMVTFWDSGGTLDPNTSLSLFGSNTMHRKHLVFIIFYFEINHILLTY